MGLTGSNTENINKKVKVSVSGSNKPPKIMEVIATSVEQSLSIVFNEGGGVKELSKLWNFVHGRTS